MNRILTGMIFLILVAMLLIHCGNAEKETIKIETVATTIPSLQALLDAKSADFAKMAPEEMKQVFAEGLRQIASSGVLETALTKGDKAPDFELLNAKGQMVRLSDLLKTGPVVLSWYRGGWCPYCNIQLNAYNQALNEFEAANGQLVAISPENPDSTTATSANNNLNFEVLSDNANRVAKQFGVVYTLPEEVVKFYEGRIDLSAYNENDLNQLPLAVTYIIDKNMNIQYAFIDADYKKRAEISELIAVLNNLK